MQRRTAGIIALAGCLALFHCSSAPPANVAATVNGRPITYEELDKQLQLAFPNETPGISEDEGAARRLEVLRSVIDNEIMLQRAEQLGLMAVDADVDGQIADLKAPYTEEEFQKLLDDRGLTEDDLRAQVRRELSVEKLWNREITAHITVTDQEVADYYEANKSLYHLVEPRLRLAQILVTPNANPDVTNLRGDKAQNEEEAKAKIADIQARLNRGEDFATVAQYYSEDPQSAPNGGDLGYLPESSLEQVSVELRQAVLALQPSEISPILEDEVGYRILKLISREPAGQRELDDPRVSQEIRANLRNRKDQLLKNAYYETARNEAEVTNYYARDIFENKGPLPR